MKKKYNVYYLVAVCGLFVGSIVVGEISVVLTKTGIEYGRGVYVTPKPKVLGETAGSKQAEEHIGLFTNPRFLEIQQSVLQETPTFLSNQHAVGIVSLEAPSNVRVFDVQNGKVVVVVWDFVEKIPAYVKVMRSETSGGEQKELSQVDGAVKGYQDTDIEIGKRYFYSLVSVGEDGEKSATVGPYGVGPIKDTQRPKQPQEVRVELMEDEKGAFGAHITWQDPDDDDLAFIRIYRSTTESVLGERIAELTPGTLRYVDQDIKPSKSGKITYYYLLTSVDVHGNESVYNLIGPFIGNDSPFVPAF